MSEVVLSREENIQPHNKVTFMDMVADAVSSGSGIDIIDRLMDAQDRYDAKIARKEFDTAMASVQAELPNITKSNVVSFDSRNGGGKTQYKFEDLASIAAAVRPILTKYGLSFRFRTKQNDNNDTVSVTCIISHKSGYSDENTLSAKNDSSGNKNNIQAVGSTVTYLERYTLKAALGLASADDDAQSVGQSFINEKQFKELQSLVDDTGADIEGFCYTYNIASLAELPSNMFLAAKNVLSARKSKQQQKAKETANANNH